VFMYACASQGRGLPDRRHRRVLGHLRDSRPWRDDLASPRIRPHAHVRIPGHCRGRDGRLRRHDLHNRLRRWRYHRCASLHLDREAHLVSPVCRAFTRPKLIHGVELENVLVDSAGRHGRRVHGALKPTAAAAAPDRLFRPLHVPLGGTRSPAHEHSCDEPQLRDSPRHWAT
jgi:hypothetical protein